MIAIGLPTPKYKGNPLDPPLRSRFQAHLVNMPSYDDFTKYLIHENQNVNPDIINNFCGFGYSFYASNEINSAISSLSTLNLPDFPIENLDKIIKITNNCHVSDNNNSIKTSDLNAVNLLNRLYPYSVILKDEPDNLKFYFQLMEKFNLDCSKIKKSQLEKKSGQYLNEIYYELISVEKKKDDQNKKLIKFKSKDLANDRDKFISFEVVKGNKNRISENESNDSFIMNDYHSSQLVDMMLTHSSGSDFCLIGAPGSGKSELIRQFAKQLDYDIQTVNLYKDMSTRDLIQQRITMPNGDTKWQNSPIIDAALSGNLVILGN